MSIPIEIIRAASKAARAGAALHHVSPVTATRAVNDTVREGIANLIPSSAITRALKGSLNALETGKPPRAGTNAGGFYEDTLSFMDFHDFKKEYPTGAGSFNLPRVPKGTVSTGRPAPAARSMTLAQKRAMIARKKKAGPKGGMQ